MGFQRFVDSKLVGFGSYGTARRKTIPLFRIYLGFQHNGDGIIYQYGKVGKDLFFLKKVVVCSYPAGLN